MKYVDELIAHRRGGRISANEIGIIAPYRKQVGMPRTARHGKHSELRAVCGSCTLDGCDDQLV